MPERSHPTTMKDSPEMTTRRRWIWLVVALILGLTTPAAVLPATQQVVAAFVNAAVVPMDSDRVILRQVVIVRGGQIEAVGSDLRVPSGAIVIDAHERFLVPGLADMHVHLPAPDAPTGRSEDELFLYVANGVTTVRSMAGFDSHIALREKVREGQIIGPTMYLAGPGLDGGRVKSPEDGVREVRAQKQRGYDVVKVLPGLSLASYDAIAATARDVRLPFAGHVPPDVGIQHVIEQGQATIEHLDGYLELLKGRTPLSDEAFVPIVAKTTSAGVRNVPTMAVMAANVGAIETTELLARPELRYIAKDYIDHWLLLRARTNIPRNTADVIQANRMRLLKALSASGATILFGTDSPQLFNAPGFSIVREMQMMADAGLTRYEVLRSATVQAGAFFNRPCGTITPGACADLVLLDGNPLHDLRSFNRIHGVMLRGRWLPRADIDRRLDRIERSPDNYKLLSRTKPARFGHRTTRMRLVTSM